MKLSIFPQSSRNVFKNFDFDHFLKQNPFIKDYYDKENHDFEVNPLVSEILEWLAQLQSQIPEGDALNIKNQIAKKFSGEKDINNKVAKLMRFYRVIRMNYEKK